MYSIDSLPPLLKCFTDIKEGMKRNFLHLHCAKSEILFFGHLTARPKPFSGLKQMQKTWKSSLSLSIVLRIKSVLLSETAIISYRPSLNLNKFCPPKTWKKLPHSLHLVSISAILQSCLPHLQFKMQLQEC